MRAVRLSDVAQDAGVSLATASRVLNGSSRVPGKAVAEKVRRSAAKLGYVANAQAQALARSRSGLIGLVVHDISDPYFATFARSIQQKAFASRSQVMLTQTERDLSTEAQAIRSLIAQQVDALILVGTHRYGPDSDREIITLLEGFRRNGGKVVSIGQSYGVGRTIATENMAAAQELATSLIVAGHRRFATLQSSAGIPSAADRTGGFHAALAESDIEPELSISGTLDRDGGHAVARQIAEHLAGSSHSAEEGPLCVFAPADVMALGVMGELRRLGIDVPGQVAVAGFGGVPDAADASPSLTTIALPLEKMATDAVEWVLSRDHDDAEPDEVAGTADPAEGELTADGAAAPAGSASAEASSDESISESGEAGADERAEIRVRGDVLLRESTELAPRS